MYTKLNLELLFRKILFRKSCLAQVHQIQVKNEENNEESIAN